MLIFKKKVCFSGVVALRKQLEGRLDEATRWGVGEGSSFCCYVMSRVFIGTLKPLKAKINFNYI